MKGNHQYWLDDGTKVKRRLPSVTGLLDQLGKPALVNWAARVAADYATDNWEDLANQTPSLRRDMISNAHRRNASTAAASGTQLHSWAEDLLHGRPVEVPEAFGASVNGLARWWEKSGWQAVRSEVMVWSDDDQLIDATAYAGTFDLVALDGTGRTVLADLKTGKGIWPEVALQLAGYANASYQVAADGTDDANVTFDRWCVLHVRPDGTDLYELDDAGFAAASIRFDCLRMLHAAEAPELKLSALAGA